MAREQGIEARWRRWISGESAGNPLLGLSRSGRPSRTPSSTLFPFFLFLPNPDWTDWSMVFSIMVTCSLAVLWAIWRDDRRADGRGPIGSQWGSSVDSV